MIRSKKSAQNNMTSAADIAKDTRSEFEKAGFDVPPVNIRNAAQASKEIEYLSEKIAQGVEWDEQVKAIKRGMGLVNGGALEFDEFSDKLSNLGPGLVAGCCNLRSALVKQSCLFIAQLVHNLRKKFAVFGEVIAPLSKQTTHGTLIIAESCKLAIFEIPKLTIMETMDEIAVNFLYKPFPKHKLYSIPGLEISDSIRQNVMTEPLPKLPSMPSAANLGFTSHHTVCAMENIDDGAFICQIPGLLCHQDEIRAEEGIPRTCITIQGTPVAIDISQTTSKYALYIRRSFHFNCVVKLQIVNGNVCAMLYAARSRGPITDERSSSSGPAIMKGTELFLPFDSDLPYPIEKKAWKIKKTKPPTKTRPKPKQKQNNNTNNNQTKPPPTKNVAKGSERSQKNKNSHDQTNKNFAKC
ncbi:hypothetical protein TVAG_296440 [Trichomonas vaginalis G3]|uniref:Uncharacterized protein n=1 Tax=Trichomonas vaginalis (strain ATCC PRA-98 / G3) TaxID=412133 RepID=A2GUY0_TRIV3|nr:hypothetical protein TVAG_296440 [Trichomonas vaginalis G3]|eukprot:XP_001291967.1 hypothetical protein [Trichomonas vaginalis G3]